MIIADNIYFQGFFFEQNNINSLDEAKEFINTMFFNTLLDNDFYNDINIIFLNNYNNFYFKTNSIKDNAVINLYKSMLFGTNDNIRNNIFINHFFKINNKFNHIELYKIISNIENIKRLLIAYIYHLAPNLPYHKKDNIIFSNDINNYYQYFLDFKTETLNFNKFVEEYKKDRYKKKKLIYNWLDGIFKEYSKIEYIREIIRNHDNMKDLYNIRGAIAHNKMFKKYAHNNIRVKDLLNYQEYTENCKIIYKELYKLLKELLKKINMLN